MLKVFIKRWNKSYECQTSIPYGIFKGVLKDLLVVNEGEKKGMLNGKPPPPRKLKWRRLEERIWKRTTKFNEL